MTGLALVLKSFGVKFTDEHIAAVEAIIPQIPQRVGDAIRVFNETMVQLNGRVERLESGNAEIVAAVDRLTAAIQEMTDESKRYRELRESDNSRNTNSKRTSDSGGRKSTRTGELPN